MIHLEAGYSARLRNDLPPGVSLPEAYRLKESGWQEYFWPTVVELVRKADEYGFKLTLAFNPQWGRFLLRDRARLALVRRWQRAGHEVGFHHHARNHPDWNGYSNDPDAVEDPLYLGTVDDGFSFVKDVAAPVIVVSGTLGRVPVDDPSLMAPPADKDLIQGVGNMRDSYPRYGPLRGLAPRRRFLPGKGCHVVELTIRELSTVMNGLSVGAALPILQAQYAETGRNEVFGVVFHEFDYFRAPELYVEWFDFIKKRGDVVRTMSEVAEEYFKKDSTSRVPSGRDN